MISGNGWRQVGGHKNERYFELPRKAKLPHGDIVIVHYFYESRGEPMVLYELNNGRDDDGEIKSCRASDVKFLNLADYKQMAARKKA